MRKPEFEFNKDVKLRDSMLHWNEQLEEIYKRYNPKYPQQYDIAYFDQLDSDTLQRLIDLKFADPSDTQNDAPSIKEFLAWMKENPDYKAHGYVTSITRDDYRVSVEGVDGKAKDKDALIRFVQMFHEAEEFDVSENYQRAWYD